MMNRIVQGTSENMAELEDGAVSLTVTSPPYWNSIDYDIHASDKAQYYRTRQYSTGYSDYDNYLDWIDRVYCGEVLRVTKPGGFCCIVVGTVLFDGHHIPVPFDFVNRLTRGGWEFHQDIIWHKCTAGVKRAGVAIQKPFPGYFYPNIMTEYILVFRKPGPKIFEEKPQHEKDESNYPIDRIFTRDVANNVWHIAPIPPNYLDHPCPFPEEIPYRLITLYSYKGDLVLDPFVGSGQTTKVANALGRCYAGYDLIEKYVELSQARIDEPLRLRKEQLIAVFEKEPLNPQSPPKPPSKGLRRAGRKNEAGQMFFLEKQNTDLPPKR